MPELLEERRGEGPGGAPEISCQHPTLLVGKRWGRMHVMEKKQPHFLFSMENSHTHTTPC